MAKAFLDSIKQQVFSWFARAQAADIDQDLVELPEKIQAQLTEKIKTLPPPAVYRTTIHDSLAEAIQTWQQEVDASNTLVVLADPTEAIATILKSSVNTWPDAPEMAIVTLPYACRPRDPLTMSQYIQQALESYEQLDIAADNTADNQDTNGNLDNRTTLIVIPCLEQCFLRCIGGWDSVEYLRDIVIRNRNCFWVIGCNRLAWSFLDFVCQISAYFDQAVTLPKIDGDMLRSWIEPLGEAVIESDQREVPLKSWLKPTRKAIADVDEEDSDDDSRQLYWNSLVTQSMGVAAVAVRLWQSSLRLEPQQADAENPSLDSPDTGDAEAKGERGRQRLTLHETAPALPKFPKLTYPDRYLLHALLIHGPMTRAHLALSLGQTERQTQASIQKLLREEVLEQRNGRLTVQALHYPKLRTELASNNFFLEED
ncbi:MAG: hypothetical protein WBA10_15735 [Elainellaceae cyanobacterium]